MKAAVGAMQGRGNNTCAKARAVLETKLALLTWEFVPASHAHSVTTGDGPSLEMELAMKSPRRP